MTLRERLIALAHCEPDEQWIPEKLAISAAKMALEDAERACQQIARHDYESAKEKGKDRVRRVAMGNRCDDCAEDIRALREGLE